MDGCGLDVCGNRDTKYTLCAQLMSYSSLHVYVSANLHASMLVCICVCRYV